VTRSQLIASYILAKDSNRPSMMPAIFARDAMLDMVVNTRSIAFPPRVTGVDAITDVLVRQFCETYDNIHTFCLCQPPATDSSLFSCPWLVGMSGKADGKARVGCGRYDWSFRGAGPSGLVDRLKITIDSMQELPPSALPAIMSWLQGLPYPWCPLEAAVVTMPRVAGLEPLARGLKLARGQTTFPA